MSRSRSDADSQVAELLRVAKDSLGLSTAFLSRLDGTTQHLEVVETSLPVLFREGVGVAQETSFCQHVLDGKLPEVMADVTREPVAMALPSARVPRIRSFISVPVTLSDGTLYGTFCVAGLQAHRQLGKKDAKLLRVLAHAAAVIVEPHLAASQRAESIHARLHEALERGGPLVVVQPIVDLATGIRVGSEALSRFPPEWGMAPDEVFAQAHEVGKGHLLELVALAGAAAILDAGVSGYLAMNVSSATLMTPECSELLRDLPLDRVLLELSEHDPVEDYAALTQLLLPFRSQGLRLAIDDVGSGFSSLRHVILTNPDVIKLDRSVVAGVAEDPVLRSLIASLVAFGHGNDVRVVAEGIETSADADVLADLGVDYGQGWFFGRPGPPQALVDRHPTWRAELDNAQDVPAAAAAAADVAGEGSLLAS